MIFFLTALLRKSESGARVIFTSSFLSYFHPITANSVKKSGIEKNFEIVSYCISKFCQIAASELFAKKLKRYGITSNCFHPYAAKTNIFADMWKRLNWLESIGAFTIYLLIQIAGKVRKFQQPFNKTQLVKYFFHTTYLVHFYIQSGSTKRIHLAVEFWLRA